MAQAVYALSSTLLKGPLFAVVVTEADDRAPFVPRVVADHDATHCGCTACVTLRQGKLKL